MAIRNKIRPGRAKSFLLLAGLALMIAVLLIAACGDEAGEDRPGIEVIDTPTGSVSVSASGTGTGTGTGTMTATGTGTGTMTGTGTGTGTMTATGYGNWHGRHDWDRNRYGDRHGYWYHDWNRHYDRNRHGHRHNDGYRHWHWYRHCDGRRRRLPVVGPLHHRQQRGASCLPQPGQEGHRRSSQQRSNGRPGRLECHHRPL